MTQLPHDSDGNNDVELRTVEKDSRMADIERFTTSAKIIDCFVAVVVIPVARRSASICEYVCLSLAVCGILIHEKNVSFSQSKMGPTRGSSPLPMFGPRNGISQLAKGPGAIRNPKE